MLGFRNILEKGSLVRLLSLIVKITRRHHAASRRHHEGITKTSHRNHREQNGDKDQNKQRSMTLMIAMFLYHHSSQDIIVQIAFNTYSNRFTILLFTFCQWRRDYPEHNTVYIVTNWGATQQPIAELLRVGCSLDCSPVSY